jgi:hypothetical protein
MEHVPRVYQVFRSTLEDLEPYFNKVMRLQWNVVKAIKEAQGLLEAKREKNFKGYNVGDKVWIEGTNIRMTYLFTKLTA